MRSSFFSPESALACTLLAALPLLACQERDGIPLVRDGASAFRIVLSPNASPSEERAAQVLQTQVEACTGARLPIARSGAPPAEPSVLLGFGPATRSLGIQPDGLRLGEQGFLLRTHRGHLVIAGTAQAGTLYGVYQLLEDYLGIRWYAPGFTRTPRRKEVTIPQVDRVVRPPFFWRHTSWAWPGADADFHSHARDNDGAGGPEHAYGRQYRIDGRAHSYFRYVSPDEFFDTHPEYFSEVGGVRLREETQLCLTNPDVLEIVTERMLQRMRELPEATQHNFSQQDHYNYCQCERCRAINERYGTAGGTQFWFVNQLAARTAAVFPDKLIGTLAYTYSEEPPRGMRMHPNVAVWLCHMYPSCDSHPIATCPLNASFKRRAEQWSRQASHLYIWHYSTNFTHYYVPFPNFRALAADLRFYRDLGVEGIYLQGMGHRGGGGEFSLLRPYYAMRLMWNPDQDADGILRDFLGGYYGAAGKPLWEYVSLLHDKVEREDIHMHLYTNPAQGYLPDPVLKQASGLFDQAEALVASDPELLERVRVARMPLTYAKIFPRHGYRIENQRVTWQSELASYEEVEAFIRRMKEHGFTALREQAGEPDLLMDLYLLMAAQPPVHTLTSASLQVDVVPLLAGRALRITHRQAPQETVTASNVTRNLFFPFAGGLEDRVGEGAIPSGWVEPAAVTAQTESSITTRATTLDGFELTRTLRLDAEQPILHVESVVRNPGGTRRETRLRSHLELDLGEVAQTRVRFTTRGGQTVDRDLAAAIAGLREGEHFYDADAPAGAWTFSGTKGLEVTQRFDPGRLDSAWIYAYPADLGEVEVELWAPKVSLGPGEAVSFSQQIEVRPARGKPRR